MRADLENKPRETEYAEGLLADFYSPEKARQGMRSPQRLLGGRVPADLIRAGRTGEVLRLINQMRDGVYL